VQSTLDALVPLLGPDDVVIDGGNSYYRDDMTRAQALQRVGIHYVDVGTSGGIWGLERGFCLMIGGEAEVVRGLDPIFKTIAPGRASASPTPSRTRTDGTAPDGYLHCGPNGAGHFVKMVHNGVEYGMMASIAEGLSIIKHANADRETRVADAETAPLRDPEAYSYAVRVAAPGRVHRQDPLGHAQRIRRPRREKAVGRHLHVGASEHGCGCPGDLRHHGRSRAEMTCRSLYRRMLQSMIAGWSRYPGPGAGSRA